MNGAEAQLVARELAGVHARVSALDAGIKALACEVLQSGTWQFGPNGSPIEIDNRVPFQAVEVANRSGSTIIIEGAPSRGANTPTLASVNGPSIWDLDPYQTAVINVRSTALTIYGGSSGDRVQVQMFSRVQAPARNGEPTQLPSETLSVAAAVLAAVAATPLCTLVAPPAGLYEIFVKGHYGGTVAVAVERNNIGLKRAGVLIYTLPLPGQSASNSYDVPTSPRLQFRLNGTQDLTLNALIDGTATAVYDVGLTALRVGV